MTNPAHRHLREGRWQSAGCVIFGIVTPLCNIHRKGYLMLHHFSCDTIQIASLVNYNCHPPEDGNNTAKNYNGYVKQLVSLLCTSYFQPWPQY